MPENTMGQLNPLQSAVLKRVQKNTEMQVDEAMQQGVPAVSILESIGIPSVMGDARQQQNQQPKQKQPVQQQQTQQPNIQAQQDQGQNVLQQLLGGLQQGVQGLGQGQLPTLGDGQFNVMDLLTGIAEGYQPGFGGRMEAQKASQQQRKGEVPMQKGELQRFIIKGEQATQAQSQKAMEGFFSGVLSPKPLPAETSKVLGFTNDSLDALKEINKVFETDPKLLRNLSIPGNPLGQQLKFLKDLAGNSLLRKESGAAISAEERKFINKLLSPVGAKAFFEDESTTKLKLDTIINNLERQKNYLQPNEGLKERIQSAIQSGFSREEIFQKLRERGEV